MDSAPIRRGSTAIGLPTNWASRQEELDHLLKAKFGDKTRGGFVARILAPSRVAMARLDLEETTSDVA